RFVDPMREAVVRLGDPPQETAAALAHAPGASADEGPANAALALRRLDVEIAHIEPARAGAGIEGVVRQDAADERAPERGDENDEPAPLAKGLALQRRDGEIVDGVVEHEIERADHGDDGGAVLGTGFADHDCHFARLPARSDTADQSSARRA